MEITKYSRKFIGKWFWIPITKYYLSKERNVKVGDINLKIPTGIFHPTLFLSTQYLLEYINSQIILSLNVLELGAGSGFLSIMMAKRGAIVTASDISHQACCAVQDNAAMNNVSLQIIHSDIFDKFGKTVFDLILINPPYYPKDPQTEAEKAWFCGSKFDYFQKLFSQLAAYIGREGRAIMILSEDCNIEEISRLATYYGYMWKKIDQKKKKGEWNYLFEITT